MDYYFNCGLFIRNILQYTHSVVNIFYTNLVDYLFCEQK